MQVGKLTSAQAYRAPSRAASAAPAGPADSVLLRDDRAERDRYYGSALQAKDGQELFRNLHTLLTDTHSFSMDYSSTLKVAPLLSLYPDGTMHCVYSGVRMEAPSTAMPPYIQKLSQEDPAWAERWAKVAALAGTAPEAAALALANDQTVLRPHWEPNSKGGLKEIDPYSLEHLVPQSWFERARPMRTDLHILSPVENSANSARGNLPLQDLNGNGHEVAGGASDLKAFDPKLGKGEAARATLYFLLRHPGLIGDQPGEYTPQDLQRMLRWHKQYPVSDFERHKNAEIQQIQGNRNPLVDFPELADRIDFTLGFGQRK